MAYTFNSDMFQLSLTLASHQNHNRNQVYGKCIGRESVGHPTTELSCGIKNLNAAWKFRTIFTKTAKWIGANTLISPRWRCRIKISQ
jgi:hypothetical protein